MADPILKIGAVVVRQGQLCDPGVRSATREPQSGRGQERSDIGDKVPFTHDQILILQPIPKTPGEIPAFVLPRGSRQYRDELGQWHDARDVQTGIKHAATLEPFARGLAREVEEEAGVTHAMLARARTIELGEMAFQSRTKGVYPIYWFVVVLNDADAAMLTRTVPADALSSRWASIEEIRAMAVAGEFSAGYVPVIERALEHIA